MTRAGKNSVVFATGVFIAFLVGSAIAIETIDESSGATASAIVNGAIVATGSTPWMAAIVGNVTTTRPQRDTFTCGATLIDPLWVLTAAHCVSGENPEDLKLIIGSENLDDSTGEARLVTEIIRYPDYDNAFWGVDIALLRLAEPSTKIPLQIITPNEQKSLEGQPVTVFGWGVTAGARPPDCELVFQDLEANTDGLICDTIPNSFANRTGLLMSAGLTLASTLECNSRYREVLTNAGYPPNDLPVDEPPVRNALCAWDRTNLSSPCYGDSGGPLVGKIGGRQVLVGIVSNGLKPFCETVGQIGFYTQVTSFGHFIAETKGRSLDLAFGTFCPRAPEPSVSYAKQSDGNTLVTVSWPETANASGYRLYYAQLPRQGSSVGKLDLSAPAKDFSVALASGLKFGISLQALADKCDSPISALTVVSVP